MLLLGLHGMGIAYRICQTNPHHFVVQTRCNELNRQDTARSDWELQYRSPETLSKRSPSHEHAWTFCRVVLVL